MSGQLRGQPTRSIGAHLQRSLSVVATCPTTRGVNHPCWAMHLRSLLGHDGSVQPRGFVATAWLSGCSTWEGGMTRNGTTDRRSRFGSVVDSGKRVNKWVVRTANLVTGSASSPLATVAALDAFRPSLMPRSSVHQGVAAGLAIIAARSIGGATEWMVNRVIDRDASIAVRLGARGAVAAVGLAATRIPKRDDEATGVTRARSAGELLMYSAAGGAIHDVGRYAQDRYPAGGSLRPMLGAAAGLGAAVFAANRRLGVRTELIERWTEEDKPAQAVTSIAIAAGIGRTGIGVGRAFAGSRNAMMRFMGPGVTRSTIARTANAAMWAGGAWTAYLGLVSYIARTNEKIEPAYSTPPLSPYVSGDEGSLSPFGDLGLQGRRYVTDVVTPELIEEVMGEPAVAHPIRAYVGYNSDPLYASGRAEIALEEMERLGAFDRSYLLLVSATGTGWVDQTMIESAEFLTRGDIATCCIQYGRSPSFLAVHKVALGRSQFRQLLWGVRMRLAERPPESRPKVIVFGESLGAWSSSDVVMYQGIDGFDHYGIDKALWVGLPGLAKWSKTGMRYGSGDLVPAGTVAAFDRPEQFEALEPEAKRDLRAVVLDHDNDPIAAISFDLLLRRPDWLGAERGRGVPEQMDWIPIITFVHTTVDAMNAMRTVPGHFKSFGHDYRGDMARLVYGAYGLPEAKSEQIEAVDAALRSLELERGERIKAAKAGDAPPAPQYRDAPHEVGGVPLRRGKSKKSS